MTDGYWTVTAFPQALQVIVTLLILHAPFLFYTLGSPAASSDAGFRSQGIGRGAGSRLPLHACSPFSDILGK